ncbi:hypothetical protein CH063_03262 [Colletotrichum higginsianum]|uniref:C6 transcription factor n=1 Tax=Colletotrichum higginsianum (strain IMI 349063) TaxID=759273 RepID=H1VVA2_COLHI|nr:C6 transcription factor [Colletotrichum higginsianum IMI 349063]OBR14744.1 C6 transcription factor [Colletotrichum higginsianum IMI 349063]CCF44161.1 hypothetical protein CH063_03262 [Colletotrichum higginsianum]
MTDHHRYREIRPVFELSSGDDSVSSLGKGRKRPFDEALGHSQRSSASKPTPKRRNALVACESCKKRKTKCSAGRPSCSSCANRGIECRYTADPSESRAASMKRRHDEMASRNTSLHEFFSAMRSMPDEHAYEIFSRIRSGVSAEDIIHEIEVGCLLVKLSASTNPEAPRLEPEVAEVEVEVEVESPAPKANTFDMSWAYPPWAHRRPMSVT